LCGKKSIEIAVGKKSMIKNKWGKNKKAPKITFQLMMALY